MTSPQDQPPRDLTRFLDEVRMGLGDEERGHQMMAVYTELRAIAAAHMHGQRANHTLHPTALVNEVYLKLFKDGGQGWNDRKHFYALAAKAMRQLLVDHARSRQRDKRGGGRQAQTLDQAVAEAAGINIDLIDLDAALHELAALDDQQARIVELRFFIGQEMGEIADILGVSKSTVEREWRAARAWLGVRLDSDPG